MKRKVEESQNRLIFLLIIAVLLFVILIFRLGYWQIYKGEELRKEALSQWTKGIDIKPKRGIIYDRNGKKLAVSQSSSTIWVSVAETNKEKRNEEIEKVSEILNLDKKEVEALYKKGGHQKLKQWADEEEVKKLKESKISGIQIIDDYRRYYPYENLASHIIGFTDIDGVGLYGLENTYDTYLSGNYGKWIKTADPDGKQLPFDKERYYEAEDGLSLVLTIDEKIQQIIESYADEAIIEHGAENVSILVMEPSTGEVLGMANKPDYNPNNPYKAMNEYKQKEWDKLAEEGKTEELEKEWYDSWRNFAINDLYEPGSTFKLITAAIALEENIVNENTPFNCTGTIPVAGATLSCTRGHGYISFREGMNVSCNTAFVNTARMIGQEKFLKYVKAFGFGEKTGIELNGEQSGLAPAKPEDIRDVNLATMSYGYGVAMTPLQLTNAISAIANGGNLMKPRLVKALVDDNGKIVEEFKPEVKRRVISEETSEKMLSLMETVVSKGSGKASQVEGYKIGGKTGTAKKAIEGRYIDGKYIGSFSAVAPVDGPEFVVSIIIDDPEGVYYGGSTAAPLAKDIIEEIIKYLELKPTEEIAEKPLYAEDMVEVPELIGKTLSEAGELLIERELKHMTGYSNVETDSIVSNQIPPPGEIVEKGSVIELEFEKNKGETRVPNLLNLDEEGVKEELKGLNIDYKIEGEGVVIEQSIEPETIYDGKSVLEIKLE